MPKSDPHDYEVVVVGAGLAGLSAAAELERAGVSVAVVETRPEVGGRTRSRILDGAVADLGGQFVGTRHRRMRRLVASLGLTLVPARLGGGPVLWRVGRRQRVGFLPTLSPSELYLLGRALVSLGRLSSRVDGERPWYSPGAEELDQYSLAGWLDEAGLFGRAREGLEALICGFATVDARESSLLQVLWWVKRAGGLLAALRSGTAFRIREGTQAVPLGLAARLHGPVLCGTPVARIEREEDGVTIRHGEAGTIRARWAILAVPLPALKEIIFSPSLDAAQRSLVEELRFGRAVKVCAAVPAAPSARQRTFVGGEPLSIGWRTGRSLDGIAYGEYAERPRDELLADLAEAFGLPPSAMRTAETVHWDREPSTGGSYIAFGPGQLTRHGPHLSRSHGTVHFAGAERSSQPVQMEGAVESGVEAAHRVLAEHQRG